jgi:hypothetical protein
MRMAILKLGIILYSVLCLCCNVWAHEKQDTLLYKNAIKFDFVPVLYDVAYYHQLRVGLEYERNINPNTFVSCNVDAGIYNEYSFTKYYDFFNQNQGLYYVQQNVLVKGFHILPAYNYYMLQSKRKLNQGVYAGVILDFHYYNKALDTFNSHTSEKANEKYFQTKLGMGFCIGAKYDFTKHFFAELKTTFLVKLFKYTSAENKNEISPLNAQWVDSKTKVWWVSNVMIGYAF